MNWVDFDGVVVDLDEIIYVKKGRWSNEHQKFFATFVHKSGQEIELRMFYVDVLVRLKQLSRKEIEA